MLAIVDANVLVAATDANDPYHRRCLDELTRPDLELAIPSLVITEVCYFLDKRFGPAIEARFLRGLQAFDVLAPEPEEWPAIADLVERYSSFPLGGTDASVAVLAERMDTDVIITLDRRHFGALKMPSGRTFTLLPE